MRAFARRGNKAISSRTCGCWRQFPQMRFKPHLKSWRADVFMTAELTYIGRRALETEVVTKIGNKKEWSIRRMTPNCLCYGRLYAFWEVREIEDPIAHNEILMRTQLLLTAFAVGLEPHICDQTSPASPRAGLGPVVTFDA